MSQKMLIISKKRLFFKHHVFNATLKHNVDNINFVDDTVNNGIHCKIIGSYIWPQILIKYNENGTY